MLTSKRQFRFRSFILPIPAVVMLLAGCGYRGPLYLPEDAPAETQTGEEAGVQDEAEAEEDADDEDEQDQPR